MDIQTSVKTPIFVQKFSPEKKIDSQIIMLKKYQPVYILPDTKSGIPENLDQSFHIKKTIIKQKSDIRDKIFLEPTKKNVNYVSKIYTFDESLVKFVKD